VDLKQSSVKDHQPNQEIVTRKIVLVSAKINLLHFEQYIKQKYNLIPMIWY